MDISTQLNSSFKLCFLGKICRPRFLAAASQRFFSIELLNWIWQNWAIDYTMTKRKQKQKRKKKAAAEEAEEKPASALNLTLRELLSLPFNLTWSTKITFLLLLHPFFNRNTERGGGGGERALLFAASSFSNRFAYCFVWKWRAKNGDLSLITQLDSCISKEMSISTRRGGRRSCA